MLKKENFKLILNNKEAIFFPIFYSAFGAGHFFWQFFSLCDKLI